MPHGGFAGSVGAGLVGGGTATGGGLFLGWRYRLVGPNLGRSQMVQDVMEKLDDGAGAADDQVRRNMRPKNPKNGE
ncbi:MAG: hypothetical protein V8S71_01330 [Oscillospiraceae bacterium]